MQDQIDHKTSSILSEQRPKLVDTVKKTIERYSMISPNDCLLAGVSGGADSVALLLLLIDISQFFNLNLSIGIAHVNHLLRGEESDRDEKFAINLAQKHNLPCYTIKVDVSLIAKQRRLSFEEAAREVRYSFYSQILEQDHYNKIALGHNSDDNAELVLMNILRGSGTKGISGIPPVRENWIIRPLIEVSRDEIVEYLRLKQQTYLFDSSNNDTTYIRNRVRHQLIPYLKEMYNPAITVTLNRLSRIITDENGYMEQETERVFNNSLLYREPSAVHLNPKTFKEVHCALAKRLARRAIEDVKGDLRKITFGHIDDIIQLIYSKSGGTTLHLPDRIRVIKSRQSICFRKESRPLRDIGDKK